MFTIFRLFRMSFLKKLITIRFTYVERAFLSKN